MKIDRLKTDFVMGGYFPRTLDAAAGITRQQFGFEKTQSNDQQTYEYFMSYALLAAMNAIGWSSPNPSVGCVIVKNGKIIAQGFTQSYGLEHAERMAFQEIEKQKNDLSDIDLGDAIAYVTLEPCAHQGHQPPCVDLFLKSKIKKIVIACVDPDDRVSGRSIEVLTQANKEVVVGVLENECKAWHFPFLENRLTQKKVWAAKWAQTPSGLLANADGTSKWITGTKSRAYTHWLRQKYDAILVGSQTWLFDRPQLTARNCAEPLRRHPEILIYDPNGKILLHPLGLSTLEGRGPIRIFVKEHLLKSKLNFGSQPGHHPPNEVEWTAISDDHPVDGLIEGIESLSIQSVMVEGGPKLLNLLFQKEVFTTCHQFIGPKEFTDASDHYRLPGFNSVNFFKVADQKIDDDLLHEWSK